MCLDINTLKPVWIYDVGDDTDTTTVIEEHPKAYSCTRQMRSTREARTTAALQRPAIYASSTR